MNNSKSGKMKVEGSIEDIIALAHGGTVDKMQGGGMVEGPSHEEGGVDVIQEGTEEPIAEVEGGERIFSIEDTQMLEQAAMQIVELMNGGNQKGAEDMAMRLGFAVVNMIAEQEKNQAAQEQGMDQQAAAQSMNSFQQEPDNVPTYQPMT